MYTLRRNDVLLRKNDALVVLERPTLRMAHRARDHMPPSDEGGGFAVGEDGGREDGSLCVSKEEAVKVSPSVSFADSSLVRGSRLYNPH